MEGREAMFRAPWLLVIRGSGDLVTRVTSNESYGNRSQKASDSPDFNITVVNGTEKTKGRVGTASPFRLRLMYSSYRNALRLNPLVTPATKTHSKYLEVSLVFS